jgi:hypothetical protein
VVVGQFGGLGAKGQFRRMARVRPSRWPKPVLFVEKRNCKGEGENVRVGSDSVIRGCRLNVRFGPLCRVKSDISRGPRSEKADIGGGLFISVFSTWPSQTALVFQLELTADYASHKVDHGNRPMRYLAVRRTNRSEPCN